MLPRALTRLSRPSVYLLKSSTTSSTTAANSATRTPFLASTTTQYTRGAATTTHTATENAPYKGSDGGHDPHEEHYDAPGGWLWGERPGEKYEREGWEYPFYIGFVGSWIVAIVAYTMKEDTSIQTWALEEARRRLEKEGILEDSNN